MFKNKEEEFRNYNESEKIRNVYKKMHTEQTMQKYNELKTKYNNFPNKKYKIWDLINLTSKIQDESDPDTNNEQIHHLFQTAEEIERKFLNYSTGIYHFHNFLKIKDLFSKKEWDDLPRYIKNNYESLKFINRMYCHIKNWDWLLLVGLIHDLGKILVYDEFGALEQHFVVGDTYPLGCPMANSVIFSKEKFYNQSEDFMHYNNDSLLGIYKKFCGLNNLYMSFGHDEFLASILEKNNVKLLKEAIYIIRFHSFYAWHTPILNDDINKTRGYTYFANSYDWYMLPLLKVFQKCDLYSKSKIKINPNILTPKYDKLIKKYIGNEIII